LADGKMEIDPVNEPRALGAVEWESVEKERYSDFRSQSALWCCSFSLFLFFFAFKKVVINVI
jgi:hypothetical protein